MRKYKHYLKSVVAGLVMVNLLTFSALCQNTCKCDPEISFILKDCVKQNEVFNAFVYVYDPSLKFDKSPKKIKIFQNNVLLFEKSISPSGNGFYYVGFDVKPQGDTRLSAEFFCNGETCFASSAQFIRTIPEYEILKKDISCAGQHDGEVALKADSQDNLSIVWESGEKKNVVTGLAPGLYNITLENTNGCNINHKVAIEEAQSLVVKTSLFSVKSNQTETHYIKAIVHGGHAPYKYDWNHAGFGERDYMICDDVKEHTLIVVDDSGCEVTAKFQFKPEDIIKFEPNDTRILADEAMPNNLYRYNLMKSLDPKYGDMDGDKNVGSVFDVKFFDAGVEIADPDNFISTADKHIKGVVTDAVGEYKTAELTLTSGFFLLKNNGSTACDYASPIKIEAVTLTGNPLPAGGVFKVLERGLLIDHTSNVLSFNTGNNAWYWDPSFKPPVYSSPLRYILYYIRGTDTLQSQLNVVSPSGSVDILKASICGNGDLVQVLCSPKDGNLTGPGLTTFSISDPNSDQIIYFINPKANDIAPGNNYSYKYSIPQSTGTLGSLRCAAEIFDTLDVLLFPEIQINQQAEQVCEGDGLGLSATAIPTSGTNVDLKYQWFNLSQQDKTPISNSNSASLAITGIKKTSSFKVEVTQSNGCKAADTTDVEVFFVPKINSKILSDTGCYGAKTGEVIITLEGITDLSAYRFLWDGKISRSTFSGNHQINLPVDSFFITITTPPLNSIGLQCSIIDTVVIQSFPPLGVECSPKDTSTLCFGNFNIVRTVTVSREAVTPLSYSLVGKDGPYQSSNEFSRLGVGNDPLILNKNYTVYVKDGRGCIDSCGFTIHQPSQLEATISKTDLSCYLDRTGTATVNTIGGTAPYTYHWNNSVTFGPTFDASHTLKALAAGTYVVTVSDKNDCQAVVSVTVNQPDQIKPLFTQTDICLDSIGSISTFVSGGNGNYLYEWTLKDAGTTLATSSNLSGSRDQNVQVFDAWALTPGQVKIGLKITDDKHCSVVDSTLVNLRSCFDVALRKRVALPTKRYYAGDTVTFTIEIFNQGKLKAKDLKINDVFDSKLHFNLDDNVAKLTGNENDWSLEPDGSISIYMDSLDVCEVKKLKIVFKIDANVNKANIINWSRIIEAKSEIDIDGQKRIRINPIDEDDLSVDLDINNPPSETDDDICDTDNIRCFPTECIKPDNPRDEDKMDFAVVQICDLEGNKIAQSLCVPERVRLNGYQINTPVFLSSLDPDGNGNGVADGDAGNLVASIHPTYLDALSNTNPIQGKLVFISGDGQKASTTGNLLKNGDLEVYTNQKVQIFGRLEALDGCVGVSTVEFDLAPQFKVNEEPKNVAAITGQKDVCMNIVIDPSVNVPYKLQWQENINNNFVDILGANDSKFCIDSIKLEDDRRKFRVQVRANNDINNTCMTVSASAVFDLNDKPRYVCQDLVNVSLDDHCEALITPAMVLLDDRFESRVQIKIVDSKGNPVPNPITGKYIGQTLTVSAIDKITGNSCWSMIFIEDKLPPVIECPVDYTINCANTSFNPPIPSFSDACDPNATISLVSDVFTDLGCGHASGYIAQRIITYVAKDKYGNTSKPCEVKVNYRSSDLSLLTWPTNKTLSCRVSPGYPAWDYNNNYYPDATETGFPQIGGIEIAHYVNNELLPDNYCHISVSFTDEQINLCGNTFKVIRSWTVLNWCDGDVRKQVQLIDVKDNQGPQVVCPIDPKFVLSTKPYSCTADYIVPAPVVLADCNSTTWSVAYELRNDDGTNTPTGIFITDNVVLKNGEYVIKDLPIGITQIRYTIVDACDNVAYCSAQVKVVDNVKPVPVCHEHTVVSMTSSGSARLFAKSVDDGGHDNCSKVRFGIRRMINNCGIPSDAVVVATYQGNKYYNFVDFCCTDLALTEHQVELVVIDESDNMNTCMTKVELQQKILPRLNCPADVTVDCESAFTPQDLNSFASFTAPCPIYRLEYVDNITEFSCGEKNIVRSWNVKENSTNKIVVSCQQRIFVKNLTPFDLNTVIFPTSKTLINQCNGSNDFSPANPATGGYPTWNNIGCSLVAASYKDQIFEDVEDACLKIIRNWTVIDWCTFDPTKPATILNRQQVIKVIDTERPTAICKHLEVEVTEGCSKLVSITGDSYDSCTGADEMKYKYSLNGEPFVSSRLFNRNLNLGTYYLTWIVADKCDNKDTCIQVIVVKDTKKPTPYCITEIGTVLMPSSLNVSLWAKDYDHGAYDNCGGPLRFTFGANRPVEWNRKHYYKQAGNGSVEATEADYLKGNAEFWDPALNSSALVFDCDDVGLKDLTIYVWDKAGNNDFCTVRVKIQDNTNNCGHSRTIVANGDIHTINNVSMPGVETHIIDGLSGEFAIASTNIDGAYYCDRMLDNVTYRIEPHKDGDYLNGITTIDLVLIQRHILGIETIHDERILLAADVNNDGKVTASDISDLRKLILGTKNEMAGKRSWIFLLKDYKENDPMLIPRYASINAQKNHTYTNDFIGIKIGDINLSADAFLSSNIVKSRAQSKFIQIHQAEKISDNEYRVSIGADDAGWITGLQMGLKWDANVKVKDIVSGIIDLKPENFTLNSASLKVSWSSSEGIRIPKDGVLFDLILTDVGDVNTDSWLSISTDFSSEWIDNQLNDFDVKAKFISNPLPGTETLMVYQNTPNPFTESTLVNYYLETEDWVNITVTDVDGRAIYTNSIHGLQGMNSFELNKNMLHHKTGIMLLNIKNSKDNKIIKILRTE